MNHFVPDFDTDDDFVNVSSSSSSLNQLPTKPINMGGGEEDDLMELLWHNGQVVLQNQRPNKKPSSSSSSSIVKLHGGETAPPPMHQPLDQNLFIQEDEMSSWLHYPLRDDDFCSDLLFSSSAAPPTAPCPSTSDRQTLSQVTAPRPPAPPPAKPPAPTSTRPPVRNFLNFSRLRGNFTGGNGRGESGPSISKAIVRESTQVSPSATPSSAASESGPTTRTDAIDNRVTPVDHGSSSTVAEYGNSRKGKAVATTATASEIPGTSSSVMAKSEIEPVHVQPETEKMIVDDKKRKEREAIDETECRSEETKQRRGGSTTSTKRSRAAEVHNLSERKRRDRINERMKALQELIPRCNKSDKASMLDEAIEYMKSLQLQIQMMSMGCGMMPMVYTGMQQYMPPHMAMGMMDMNRPPPPPPPHPSFIPFPNMLAAQRPLPTQTHMGGYPVNVSLPNQQFDPTSVQPQYPGYIDPYQQFHNLHPAHTPQFQSQAPSYPSSSRVSSSKEPEDQGNHPTG